MANKITKILEGNTFPLVGNFYIDIEDSISFLEIETKEFNRYTKVYARTHSSRGQHNALHLEVISDKKNIKENIQFLQDVILGNIVEISAQKIIKTDKTYTGLILRIKPKKYTEREIDRVIKIFALSGKETNMSHKYHSIEAEENIIVHTSIRSGSRTGMHWDDIHLVVGNIDCSINVEEDYNTCCGNQYNNTTTIYCNKNRRIAE